MVFCACIKYFYCRAFYVPINVGKVFNFTFYFIFCSSVNSFGETSETFPAFAAL